MLLAAFDEQVRRRPEPDPPDGRVEDDGHVVRHVSPDGWNGVIWTDLDEAGADAVIADQVERFGPVSWEWKHYSYDRPADLPERLRAAGFTPEPQETLLIAEIADLDLDVRPPPGVALRTIDDERDIAAFVEVQNAVFGGDRSALGEYLRTTLGAKAAGVIAWAGDTPVATARLEFHAGTDFAGLWGGGTLPDWRGRGVFRALVAYRAALAAARGHRYLQVDAVAASRPILRRLGFAELCTTTPFIHPPKGR